jgi:hypothetical protein
MPSTPIRTLHETTIGFQIFNSSFEGEFFQWHEVTKVFKLHIGRYFTWLFGTVCYLLMQSCALQQVPTGGPKDTTAPKVVKTIPPNGQVHFVDKKIQIAFDEYVDLNDPGKEIIITPPLDKPAAYSIKGHTLVIDLKENALKENTTYSVILGNAIKDIHEGNKLQNYHYVFSTGAYLDSLKISGKAIDAVFYKGYPNAKILLYSDTKDSSVYKRKPDYYSVADKDGNFKLENLKKADFKIYAINDKNDNLFLDYGEEIAFLKERVAPDTAKNKVLELRMFVPVSQKNIVQSYTFTPPAFTLKFGKIPESLVIMRSSGAATFKDIKTNKDISLTDFDVVPYRKSLKSQDSIMFWMPTKEDTTGIRLRISMDSVKIDTLLKAKDKLAKDAFKLKPILLSNARIIDKYGVPAALEFNLPVTKVFKQFIEVLPGKSKASVLRGLSFADSSHTLLLIDAPIDPDTITR